MGAAVALQHAQPSAGPSNPPTHPPVPVPARARSAPSPPSWATPPNAHVLHAHPSNKNE